MGGTFPLAVPPGYVIIKTPDRCAVGSFLYKLNKMYQVLFTEQFLFGLLFLFLGPIALLLGLFANGLIFINDTSHTYY